MKIKVRLSARCAVLLAANNMLIILGIGGAMYLYMANDFDRTTNRMLLQNANAVGGLISSSDHERISAEGTEDSPLYRSYRGKVIDLQEKNGLEFIYTVTPRDGKFIYTLDSGKGESHSPIGMAYRDLESSEKEAFAGKAAVSEI